MLAAGAPHAAGHARRPAAARGQGVRGTPCSGRSRGRTTSWRRCAPSSSGCTRGRHPPRKERSKRKRAARVIQARWRGTELKPEVDRDALEAIFTDFCRVYRMADMNNTIWAKLCRETKGLLDDKFTRDSGIDMVWTRWREDEQDRRLSRVEAMLREVAD